MTTEPKKRGRPKKVVEAQKDEFDLSDKHNKLTIIVELDAHDDKYYELLQGSYIIAERINDLDDLMILVKEKCKRLYR